MLRPPNDASMKKTFLVPMLLWAFSTVTVAQQNQKYSGPIIDMHLHSFEDISNPRPHPVTKQVTPLSGEEHMRQCIDIMRKHKIVLAIVSGNSFESTEKWHMQAPELVLRGLMLGSLTRSTSPEDFKKLAQERKVEALGEVSAQYFGLSPSDSVFNPYWAIAEEHGLPVGIHSGGAFPGAYKVTPKFRLRFGDPLLLEDMLVRFPKLKVYVMHAGSGMLYERQTLAMMGMYQLYVDISGASWLPNNGESLQSFLREAKKSNRLHQVMFGTDQMIWPTAIEDAINRINSYDFLTLEEKQGIFYSNAARFLGLSEEMINKHNSPGK